MDLEEIKQRHRQAVDNLATMPLVPYEAGEAVRRFVNLYCLELVGELERLQAIVDAIKPGTSESFVKALFELAWECGQEEVDSKPPTEFLWEKIQNMQGHIKRLRASEADANEWIDRLNSDIRRLKGLVRDAYMEGLDAGHNTTIDVSAEHLWADSEARAELGDD